MSLSIISINEEEKWNNIVQSFEQYNPYYLNGYAKAFKLHGDGEPLLIYFKNGETRAINIVMKRDIAKDKKFEGLIEENKYFDIITPYGYGGFIVEGNDIDQLNKEYCEYCINNNIVSEFVRFNPVIENYKHMGSIYDISNLGNTVCINTINEENIWANITSKNRNMVRKAQNSNIKIYWGRDEYLIDEFMKIYNDTMDKNSATSYYYFDREFYLSILFDLKYNAQIFYAKLNDEIISMSIILFGNKKMHYHLSASKKEFQSMAPTNLLLYEVACWGCRNGYETLHLGGGLGAKEDSLYKFKKSFSKEEDKVFCVGKKIFNKDIYKYLMNIRNIEENDKNNADFFPTYRI